LANPTLCRVMGEVSTLSEKERQAKVRRLLNLEAVPTRTAYRPGTETNYRGNSRWKGRPSERLEAQEDENVFQEMAGLVRDVLDDVRRERDGQPGGARSVELGAIL
jgi:hypothetical protein